MVLKTGYSEKQSVSSKVFIILGENCMHKYSMIIANETKTFPVRVVCLSIALLTSHTTHDVSTSDDLAKSHCDVTNSNWSNPHGCSSCTDYTYRDHIHNAQIVWFFNETTGNNMNNGFCNYILPWFWNTFPIIFPSKLVAQHERTGSAFCPNAPFSRLFLQCEPQENFYFNQRKSDYNNCNDDRQTFFFSQIEL